MLKRGGMTVILATGVFLAAAGAELSPIKLEVDAAEAPFNLLHTRLRIPAAPGELTLYYPKWIPGEHMPSGPVNNMTGLNFTAQGRPLDWQRDPEDMFTFHLQVPAGADAVEVAFDFLPSTQRGTYSSGGSSTARLLDLSWNQLLLYPRTEAPLKRTIAATLRLPPGWKFGTALPVAEASGDTITFSPAPLETLIDSPVLAGEFFRTVDLAPGQTPACALEIAADSAAALAIQPGDIRHFSRLVTEANALFGAHHYRDYHFLLTLSDHVAHFGLEHHESSDDRQGENYLTEENVLRGSAELLPHELTHSWNGKYRRPAGLATPDYQQPMHDELLWVYEGLTDYYGKVLAARSGLQTNSNFRESLAMTAAMLEHRSGRQWRSLADTAVSAQMLYGSPGEGANRRRGVDFYAEGDLIWLEADTLIRTQTGGRKSLDDFCKRFHGGQNTAPLVVPYTYDDVVQALAGTAPYDWKKFFQQRVYEITEHAPLGGIENGGWRLAWTNAVPPLLKIREDVHHFIDLNYSLGFSLSPDGAIGDVLGGSPAAKTGILEGMKLVAVDGRSWSAQRLRDAVKAAATNGAAITLLTVNNDYYQSFALDYHGGERYPILERDVSKPDLLAQIVKPLTPESATNSAAGH